jgi:hypothetical protein
MNNETFTETKYAIRHKPTQKWVHFIRDVLDLTKTNIELVDFKNCLISQSKSILEKFLKRKEINKILNYGNYNFSEFEILDIKTYE